jgi:hypothetical protein
MGKDRQTQWNQPLVKKGSFQGFIFRDLSPPVSPGWRQSADYTF